MPEIKLPNGSWWYDDRDSLGPPGGFGAVFRGRSANGGAVAVKRLQSAYQSREMRIADFLLGHGLAHVIPILDAGFDSVAGTNFIIMPIAVKSLQQQINTQGPVGEVEALAILRSIADGLSEIGDIIHRDLKPGNVLLQDGVWKLADLGLARFAEAATSLNTMREALTASYAAPEQWRSERPQKATDVYALGCIMYTLLHGAPPFSGPEIADFRHQHEFVAPPGLKGSPHLKRLAAACLAKAPELRPSIPSLQGQLQIAHNAAKGERVRSLASAAAAVSEKALFEEQQRLQGKLEDERRHRLAAEAVEMLKSIFEELESAVLRDAPNSIARSAWPNTKLRHLSLGRAALEFGALFPWIEPYRGGRRIGSPEWDVIAGAYIFAGSKDGSEIGRSANLWFGQLLEGDGFRWWEVNYCRRHDWQPLRRKVEPFGMEEIYDKFSYLVAEDPRPVTPEYVEDFLDRWLEPFSQIASGDPKLIEALMPKNFQRRQILPKFKVDEP